MRRSLPGALVQAAQLALAIALIVSAVIVSLSPLNLPCAPTTWGVVFLGAALALIAWRVRNHESRITFRVPRDLHFAADAKGQLSVLDVAIVSQIASATTQALVAVDLPSSHLPLHSTPGIDAFYLLLASAMATIAIWLVLTHGEAGRCWAALLGAGLFGSTLYLRSFAVPEAGPVYGSVIALALVAAATLLASRLTFDASRFTFHVSRIAFWSLLFLATVALAVLFSPVPGQSLDFWLRLAALLGLAAILSLAIDTRKVWQAAAWGMVLIAGGVPILLAFAKLLSLIPSFGLAAALSYRWHPTELGGANLIARSILCVVPLILALTRNAQRRTVRALGPAVLASSLFVMLYARSWEGFFALLFALGVYGAMARWYGVKRLWRRLATSRLSMWMVAAGTATLLVACALVSLRAARVLNVYSFNGRLIHWQGAALAWLDHPWIGGGPGNDVLYTPYAEQVQFFADTQVTSDDPLNVIPINTGRSLKTHAHNLLLDIGSGAGALAFIGLVGFLIAMFRLGFRTWRHSRDAQRPLLAGCLAGIMGALAWGMLDVLWVTPPFFSFPVWGLIGLLVAAHRGWTKDRGRTMKDDARIEESSVRPWLVVIGHWSLVLLAWFIVLLPSLASSHYAAGFVALQERRWSDAVASLTLATRYRPLDPPSHQLLAEAYLGQGDTVGATSAYERASTLKRGYSSYSSQLGWLAWLRGDIEQATRYFRQAIEQDPGAAWREGLHADLGLAYAARGRYDEAVLVFKEAIRLNPRLAAAPYWVPVQDAEGALDVVLLDPAYVEGSEGANEKGSRGAEEQELDPPLQSRLLAHLGTADYTPRLFGASPSSTLSHSSFSLYHVLDAVEADYEAARVIGRREAPLLLAALAEASHSAGFHDRAEQAYLEFQALQPNSAYGFRDLGNLYGGQGRLAEAQAMLERAVEVSPRDFASRYNLALLYLDQGLWTEAEQALDVLTEQALVTQFRSRLFDPDLHTVWARLHLGQGNLEQAIDARRRAAIIRESPADYLALADLYQQLGQPDQAVEQCTRAANALLRTWPRPLDPALLAIGVCLAQSDDHKLPRKITALAREHPLPGNVLLGHLHRARGQLEQALTAYQAAAGGRADEGAPHYFLGETYQALGQTDPAQVEYRRAAQLDPLESLPLLALGRLQWEQGQQDEALESFDAAVEATPGWGQAHVALGNALLALGDTEGAAGHYQQAQIADGDVDEGLIYDFAAHLAGAEVASPGPDYVRNDHFTIDGDQRRVLFVHPDSRLSYRVTLPAFSPEVGGAEGRLILAFEVATAPESWEQPGDGVAFALYVESNQVTQHAIRNTQQIFSTYIDPKHDQAEQHWHPYTIDLSDYAGQTVTLIFETSPGPAGDYRNDWAGWGAPRLLTP